MSDYTILPSQRLDPNDGLAITAEVWKEAHDYHERRFQYHLAVMHGPGIIEGLDVVEHESDKTKVTVKSGEAALANGELIVLDKSLDCDTSAEVGTCLMIWLDPSDETPDPPDDKSGPADPKYFHRWPVPVARQVRDVPPASWIELARIDRRSADAIHSAEDDPIHPQGNQIDKRFRRRVGQKPVAHVVICHHGQPASNLAREGLDELAIVCERLGPSRVAVDDDVPFARLTNPNYPHPDLVYCAAHVAAELLDDNFKCIHKYLQEQGIVLVEASPEAEPGAENKIRTQFETAGIQFRELDSDQDLMRWPHLFAKAPDGFADNRLPVLVGSLLNSHRPSVLLSPKCYSALWAGRGPGRAPSREEIRAAHEFGMNIIAFARLQTAASQTQATLQP
jgi:hypothetical protein